MFTVLVLSVDYETLPILQVNHGCNSYSPYNMATAQVPPRLKALRSTLAVFRALDGINGVAALTKCKVKTVSNWLYQYNRLPSRTYLLLQGELKRRGYIGDPKLWSMM